MSNNRSDCLGNMTRPMLAPTQEALKLQRYLRGVFFGQMIIFVLKLTVLRMDSFFQDLINALILYCAMERFDYCQLMVYIVLTLSSLL